MSFFWNVRQSGFMSQNAKTPRMLDYAPRLNMSNGSQSKFPVNNSNCQSRTNDTSQKRTHTAFRHERLETFSFARPKSLFLPLPHLSLALVFRDSTLVSNSAKGPNTMTTMPSEAPKPAEEEIPTDLFANDLDEIDAIISKDLQRLDSEAEAILDSIRNEALDTPVKQKKTKDISLSSSDDETQGFQKVRSTLLHDDDDDDDDDHYAHDDDDQLDEDEIGHEISRLNNVVRSIRQEVDAQSVDSMTSALSNLDAAAPHYYKYHKRTVLAPQDFIRKNKLYGPGVGGPEPNTPLLLVTVAIWSVVLLLIIHVNYGTLSNQGELHSMPEIVQKLADRLF